jgi:transcriptional regulator with XRE-family HTH domain
MPRLFGAKVRALRLQRQLTQADLALQLGLATQSHISYLESGRSAPSLELAVHTAYILDVTTDYLLHDTIPADRPVPYRAQPHPDLELAQHFGSRLRYLRARRNMTQVELAEHLAPATQAYVSYLENGRKTPSIDVVLRCAALFSVTTDYLLRPDIPLTAYETSSLDRKSELL